MVSQTRSSASGVGSLTWMSSVYNDPIEHATVEDIVERKMKRNMSADRKFLKNADRSQKRRENRIEVKSKQEREFGF